MARARAHHVRHGRPIPPLANQVDAHRGSLEAMAIELEHLRTERDQAKAAAGEASGEEASGERRGADAQEDGRWRHISPVVEQAEADGGGKRQRTMEV